MRWFSLLYRMLYKSFMEHPEDWEVGTIGRYDGNDYINSTFKVVRNKNNEMQILYRLYDGREEYWMTIANGYKDNTLQTISPFSKIEAILLAYVIRNRIRYVEKHKYKIEGRKRKKQDYQAAVKKLLGS